MYQKSPPAPTLAPTGSSSTAAAAVSVARANADAQLAHFKRQQQQDEERAARDRFVPPPQPFSGSLANSTAQWGGGGGQPPHSSHALPSAPSASVVAPAAPSSGDIFAILARAQAQAHAQAQSQAAHHSPQLLHAASQQQFAAGNAMAAVPASAAAGQPPTGKSGPMSSSDIMSLLQRAPRVAPGAVGPPPPPAPAQNMAPSVQALFAAAGVRDHHVGGGRAPAAPVDAAALPTDVFVEGLEAYPALSIGDIAKHFGPAVKRIRILQEPRSPRFGAFVGFESHAVALEMAAKFNGRSLRDSASTSKLFVRVVQDTASHIASLSGVPPRN